MFLLYWPTSQVLRNALKLILSICQLKIKQLLPIPCKLIHFIFLVDHTNLVLCTKRYAAVFGLSMKERFKKKANILSERHSNEDICMQARKLWEALSE